MSGTEDTVRQLLNELGSAYEARDAQHALSLFADDIIFVGTGRDELRFGHQQLKEQVDRDLSQADQLKVTVKGLATIAANGAGIAWFYAEVVLDVVAGDESFTMPMRVTGVAAGDGDRWRFRQTHFSLPVAEQAEGQSFPAAW